jgi:hypothetical protein
MLIADYVAIGALIACMLVLCEQNERVMRGVGDSATAAD